MTEKPVSSEIHSGPGFRIRRTIQRPAARQIEAYRQYSTPDISDLLNRFYTMGSEITRLSGDDKLLGPACTVKVYPGDNLMVHEALDIAVPGDVIVVDTSGPSRNGVIGELISYKARSRGVAGFVIDGLIRDLPGVTASGMPVYAHGVIPQGPLHRGPGEINFPISCAGVVVQPGDLVFGDENGVVVVPQDFVEELLARLNQRRAALETYTDSVRRGVFSNTWVDEILTESKCEISD